jgi:hypothetical protein
MPLDLRSFQHEMGFMVSWRMACWTVSASGVGESSRTVHLRRLRFLLEQDQGPASHTLSRGSGRRHHRIVRSFLSLTMTFGWLFRA